MSWTLNYKGKMYAVPDGRPYTITEQLPAAAGGFNVVQRVFYKDGTNYLESSQHYPGAAVATPPKSDDKYATPPEIFKKLMQMKNKEPSQMPKERPCTGQRVHFRHPRTDEWVTGTVINADPLSLPTSKVLLCTDEQDLKYFRDGGKRTGSGYGYITKRAHTQTVPDSISQEMYEGVPEHIGVLAAQGFVHDEVDFARYTTGRLVHLTLENRTALVSWYNREDSHFATYPLTMDNVKTGAWKNCYHVPMDYLSWCRLSENKTVEVIWPGGLYNYSAQFNLKDYVVYTGSRPLKIPTQTGAYAIAKGAILRIVGVGDQRGHYKLQSVSSCHKGLEATLDSSSFTALQSSYLPGGTAVEITAHLEFKKRDLQGQKGVVVLPTDADGDVGVEFTEDIGAGSLDGHGKSRHCLYVPVGSVQRLTE